MELGDFSNTVEVTPQAQTVPKNLMMMVLKKNGLMLVQDNLQL